MRLARADYIIAMAGPEDFALLPEVEADAGRAFAEAGLAQVAAMAPAPVGYYLGLPRSASVLVGRDGEGRILGYAVLTRVDGQAHLKELSVRRDWAGQGIGTALVRAAIERARAQDCAAMTLTTFRDVPFNAPFYQKLGFAAFSPDESWPELRAIMDAERRGPLAAHPRIAMKLDLKD